MIEKSFFLILTFIIMLHPQNGNCKLLYVVKLYLLKIGITG